MRDPLLTEFLKKENATMALMRLLTHFDLIITIFRPMKLPSDGKIYIKSIQVKQFALQWARIHHEQ